VSIAIMKAISSSFTPGVCCELLRFSVTDPDAFAEIDKAIFLVSVVILGRLG